MRPASITRAVILFATILTAAEPRFIWYPTNTNIASGMIFHFEQPRAAEASITVSCTREGKPFSITKTVNTNPEKRDISVPFETGDLDKFEVLSIKVEIAGRTFTFEKPTAGVYYPL